MQTKKMIHSTLLEEITNCLVAEFKPERIYLFGSHAWGEPDENSDIDLCVVVSKSNLRAPLRAVRALKSLTGIKKTPMDILVKTRAEFDKYKGVHAAIECKIMEDGIILYG